MDYTLVKIGLWCVHMIWPFWWSKPLKISIAMALWVPIEALCLSVFGTTPGKKWLKVQLLWGDRPHIPWAKAWSRSLFVWLKGLGLGITIINQICMGISYVGLQMKKTTSWDIEDGFRVEHIPVTPFRLYVAIAFVAIPPLVKLYPSLFRMVALVLNGVLHYIGAVCACEHYF
jgi:hypothetical protein